MEVLKEYRVDPQVIDFVVRIYEKDQTRIEIGERDVKIDVQSGIRQGCTASTVIFKMITFKIIEQLRRGTEGIRMAVIKVNSLFYADDGVLLGENEEDIRKGIEIVRRIGEEYGLKMNMRKTKCMIFNGDKRMEIGGVEVVEEMRYLGVIVENKRDMYGRQRREMVAKVRQMSSMTNSVIEKSCHRVMMGKTYWKGVVLPKVLFAAEAVNLKEEDVVKLQRAENGVLRRILKAPRYATLAGMRGEVGIGSMKGRIVRSSI